MKTWFDMTTSLLRDSGCYINLDADFQMQGIAASDNSPVFVDLFWETARRGRQRDLWRACTKSFKQMILEYFKRFLNQSKT